MLLRTCRLAGVMMILLALSAAPAAAIPPAEDSGGDQCLPPICYPPAAPSDLEPVATSAGSISLEWRTSDHWTRNELSRRPFAGGTWTVVANPPALASPAHMKHTDGGLQADAAYCYRAIAVDDSSGDRSLPSTEACAVATASPPVSPTGFTATATSHTSIALTWNDAAHNEQETRLERRLEAGPWTFVARYGVSGTGPMTRADTDLLPNRFYCYRLRAANLRGESGWTEACAATPAAPKPFVIPYVGDTLGPVYVEPQAPVCTGVLSLVLTLDKAIPRSQVDFVGNPAYAGIFPSGALVTGVTNATIAFRDGELVRVGPYLVSRDGTGSELLAGGASSHAFDGQPVAGLWRARFQGTALLQNGTALDGRLVREHTVVLDIDWSDPACPR